MASAAASAVASRMSSAFSGAANRAAQAALRPDSYVRVNSTLNNVFVTVSNLEGQVIARSSGGMIGQKHRARATPVAAKDVAEAAAAKAVSAGYKVAHLELKGPSRSRGMVLRGLQGSGLRIFDIRDVTPMPTNGCRPKAARRL